MYYGWLAPSFAAADIIIALTPSIAIRQWRVNATLSVKSEARDFRRNEPVLGPNTALQPTAADLLASLRPRFPRCARRG
jgi:hypothetical protein